MSLPSRSHSIELPKITENGSIPTTSCWVDLGSIWVDLGSNTVKRTTFAKVKINSYSVVTRALYYHLNVFKTGINCMSGAGAPASPSLIHCKLFTILINLINFKMESITLTNPAPISEAQALQAARRFLQRRCTASGSLISRQPLPVVS